MLYSVPSWLIDHKIEVRLFNDPLECFLGPDPVMRIPRARTNRARGHAIDYHNLIGTLRRKPQALPYLAHREALFPRAALSPRLGRSPDATFLASLLTELRLPSIARNWRRIAEAADRDGWPA